MENEQASGSAPGAEPVRRADGGGLKGREETSEAGSARDQLHEQGQGAQSVDTPKERSNAGAEQARRTTLPMQAEAGRESPIRGAAGSRETGCPAPWSCGCGGSRGRTRLIQRPRWQAPPAPCPRWRWRLGGARGELACGWTRPVTSWSLPLRPGPWMPKGLARPSGPSRRARPPCWREWARA